MTEFEKELVRFVSGYLDAGVSAEDYVKAFSQRLLDSVGRQSKPKVRFPHEKDIVDKVFGAGNLDGLEYDEAKALVALAKEELLKDIKPKVCEDLETEALRSAGVLLSEHFEDEDDDAIRTTALRCWKGGVIHGAKWQKEQDEKELSEKIAAAYQLGLDEKERQIMKEAVEGEVVQDLKGVNRVKSFSKIPEWLYFGDKVKLIIIKED